MRKYFLVFTLLFLFSFAVNAETAREIMEKMDNTQRLSQDSSLTKSQLSSCKYVIKDKRLTCNEKPRVKLMESVSTFHGETKKDSKSVSIILEPASEQGIGMLTYSYDDIAVDTESWLYLSALGKVKRMASGSEENREPVAFFGSEFTTEDLETGKTDEYEFKLLSEGKYAGSDVWVIEATPKIERLRKTNYSKILFWVDKKNYLAKKMEMYNKRGERLKRTIFRRVENINGFWLARDVTVMNLISKRLSRIQTLEVALDVEVDPEFLTQRTLTDKAFRERNLNQLRAQTQ